MAPNSSDPSSKNSGNNTVLFEDAVPKSMVDALEWEDPQKALWQLSQASNQKAETLAKDLESQLQDFCAVEVPELLERLPNLADVDSHPVSTAIACSDSILQSLTKIASGGSQASQEIKQLEHEKRELEEHAQDVETALILRKASDVAAQSLSAQRYEPAAAAIRDYLYLCNKKSNSSSSISNNSRQRQGSSRLTDRAKAYAGEYTIAQLESTQAALKTTILEDYQSAVEAANLQTLGKLTPLVQMVQLESEAVALYLRFLKGILTEELSRAAASQESSSSSSSSSKQQQKSQPPYIPMARVYNAAVTVLRHHLPMVSHCLYRAQGDAAVVQLVHVQVEQAVQPLFDNYVQSRQLAHCSNQAQLIYGLLEERYSGGGLVVVDDDDDHDDCGFSSQVGSLADVDASMEEAALCLQHGESYTRFLWHTVSEINKARRLRHEQEEESKRHERERKEWATGLSSGSSSSSGGGGGGGGGGAGASPANDEKDDDDDDEEHPFHATEILPAHTQLQELLAEVGGYYSVIERCLLMASMQRAFSINPDDIRHYSPLATKGNTSAVASGAVQTSIVESCLYAARRGTQRAFATGHTGTASAVANFCSDSLRGVLVEYLSRRAEDLGVGALKPGEGLIEGSSGIFAASATLMHHRPTAAGKVSEATRRQEIQQSIAWACATFNDLDVAAHHTVELESILKQSVERGFPPKTHETEQLHMCVKGLGPVAEIFKMAASNAVESLVGGLKPRIRAIVTDAVGGDHGSAAGGFSVMGTGKTTDRHTVRMNYNLDEDAYQLLEVSEGYISRLYVLFAFLY
jgi:uncharacterized membrane protein YgcG